MPTPTVTAPSPALAATAAHHAVLLSRLMRRAGEFLDAAAAGSRPTEAREALVEFLRNELLPHLESENALLFTAVRTDKTALLARAMQDQHRMLVRLVEEVEECTTPMDAGVAAGALVVLCQVRVEQEDTRLLPALDGAGLDMDRLVGHRSELVGETATE